MVTTMEKNNTFSIAVGPVNRTGGILSCWSKALAANWPGHPANLCASLIGFHLRRLKGLQGMSSSQQT